MTPILMQAVSRRGVLSALAGAALIPAFTGELDAAACVVLAGAQTEGPYWVDENLLRSDVRTDPSDGSIRPGALLSLNMQVVNGTGASCSPLVGAHVDIWHCDAVGTYSDTSAQGTVGKKYLRGYQITDNNGAVSFTTVYPRYGSCDCHQRGRGPDWPLERSHLRTRPPVPL